MSLGTACRATAIRNGAVRCVLLAAALVATGCAARPPLVAWRESLYGYVQREGHGDPMVLRDLPELRSPDRVRPGQIVYGEIGVGDRDVQGIFVGHRAVGEGVWFFFVVGVMERKSGGFTQLEDVRLAAFSPRGAAWDWRMSGADAETANTYATSKKTTGILHRGQVHGAAFPHPGDDYELTVEGMHARVRERRSGAQWALRLDEAASAAVAVAGGVR